ncbi:MULTISPECIES: sigma-70 family RNA polymerase sigma factor [Streptomyces]|uniref:Sigma-70 family RNA polymerase sigma factor n=1 Tax=Streptomyces koelreuteriae TaxID=2838015 RepID=A0ABX8G1G2_9ACTN|nr:MULTISPECIES: sigma-70 family RNA polymerase sigma factor [Streptomyces]QWB27209.1 sigma-70 family RNA polymerase sigma factor [Streptomyces koelreuteriae]UUA10293.1 sigma-70 family RNA polymerase sigma factor [Streptomyces koelreuteriae]UUA17900.1 sigma-70 family RNA polymerase sigma factor [Streptomyces sp. CRCS-T-1]
MSTAQKRSIVNWTDEELAAPLRRGESGDEQLAALYERHRGAVRSYAVSFCRDRYTADDLTSEAFTRTIDAIRKGGGPRGPWRPYLLTAVRHIAVDWAADRNRTQPSSQVQDRVDEAPGGEELTLDQEENHLVVQSFRRLPERWQAVLWYTAVKGEPAATVAGRLGISASGVASLAERAREGLREAYLSVHVHDNGVEDCGRYGRLLASVVRRKARRPGRDLKRHLADCGHCRQALHDLTDLNSRLRAVLPGAILFDESVRVLIAKGAAAGGPGPAWAGGSTTALVKGVVTVGTSAALGIGGYFMLAPTETPLPAPRPPQSASALSPSPSLSPSATPAPETPPGLPTEKPTPSRSRPVAPSTETAERVLLEGLRTTLRSVPDGRCLEPTAPHAGSAVRGGDCDGSAGQTWAQLQFLGSQVLLRNSATGLCLRAPGPGAARATQVACDQSDDRQVWRVRFSLKHSSLAVSGGGWTYLT